MPALPSKTAPQHEAPRKSRTRRNKARNLVLAIFFFILGVIGVLIPVMPQVIFFVMSLLFLSLVSPTVRRAVRRFLHRHPKMAHAYKHWRDKRRQKRRAMIRRRKEHAQRVSLRINPPGS
jgi:uncharacterized membrane protein YbaN (DUF454 family)